MADENNEPAPGLDPGDLASRVADLEKQFQTVVAAGTMAAGDATAVAGDLGLSDRLAQVEALIYNLTGHTLPAKNT